jgi:hypothetical protein
MQVTENGKPSTAASAVKYERYKIEQRISESQTMKEYIAIDNESYDNVRRT